MGMSKDAVLDVLARFKVLQDELNDAKFVAKESGMTLISTSDVNKLASIERGAEKNPDLSGYVQAEEGKGLSTNDFTDELKEKLENRDAVNVEYEPITEAEIQALFVA